MIKPLEPGPSETGETGETQQPQHNPPIASTSYLLPPLAQPRDPLLGHGNVAVDVHGMRYPSLPFQPPMMWLSDPYGQAGLVDPCLFAVSDVSPLDLNLNFFVPPSSD